MHKSHSLSICFPRKFRQRMNGFLSVPVHHVHFVYRSFLLYIDHVKISLQEGILMTIRTDKQTCAYALLFRLSLLAIFAFFLSFVTFSHKENTYLSISLILLCIACVPLSFFCRHRMINAHQKYISANPLSEEETQQLQNRNKSVFVGSSTALLFRQIPYAGLTVLLIFISFSKSFPANAVLIVLDILMQVMFRNAENEYLALRYLQQHRLS